MLRNFKLTQRPYLLFLPFLVVYIIYVLMFPTNGQRGDEARYIMFANNLLDGFYSPPSPHINLTNGPGWPFVIVPFLALGLPLICITIMNAFLYYLSTIFLYKALQEIVSQKITVIVSLFWACYYIAFQNLPFTHTETFTYLLVSLLIYFMIKAFKPGTNKQVKKYTFLAGFILGYLILTKVAFGFVLIFTVIGSVFLWLTNRRAASYRRGMFIALIGLATVAPYMLYIYQLTGRFLFWSTNAGASLYWGSTPHKGEYGDWKLELKQGPEEMGNYNVPGAGDTLIAHHKADYDIAMKYDGLEQDDAFKRMAIQNIKNHPLKYLQNCVYNLGRLVFHYPFSHAIQRPKILFVFPINGIIVTFILFSLIPTIRNWRKMSYPVRFLLLFIFMYLGISTMVTALVRMFTVAVPILLVWIAYILNKTVKVKLDFEEEKKISGS